MKYGPQLKALKVHAERGSAGPTRVLESRPDLFTHLIQFWEAYQRLTSCRYPGMSGESEIPWSAIDRYGIRYGYFGDDFEKLSHFVSFLDGVYLAAAAEKRKPGPKGRKQGTWQGTTPP